LVNTSNSLVKTAAKTMGSVPDILAGMTDLDPTITPVLDLSAVEKDAPKLAALTEVAPVSPRLSFATASSISSETAANAQAAEAVGVGAGGTMVKFEQHNHSPESLSDVEIYRQTRNQLAQFKGAMGFAERQGL
jgi:hypothetical protein